MPRILETKALILYTQIALHRPEEGRFFELWTDEDVERGHMARDGHVVYGVEDHDGASTISVWIEPGLAAGRPVQAIDVGDSGLVLATVMEQFPFEIAAGHYSISLEVSPQVPEGLDVRITLAPR